MNILRLTVDKDSSYPVRGIIYLDTEEFPLRWTFTRTSRHQPKQAADEIPHRSCVEMLRTNPPRLKKRLSDEDYRKAFHAIRDAAYDAAYTAWENSRAYIPVEIGCPWHSPTPVYATEVLYSPDI
jgi:hypothetical protein